VDEIARQARANKAMIYYHFGSKHGLYKAVLASLFAALLADVARLEQIEPDPLRRLRGLYTRFASLFAEKPALPHIILREILSGGMGTDAEAAHAFGRIVRFVAAAIAQGVETGTFRRVDPLAAHLSMLGPLVLFFVSGDFRQRVIPFEAPALRPPTGDEMLAYVLDSLERDLAPVPGSFPSHSPQEHP